MAFLRFYDRDTLIEIVLLQDRREEENGRDTMKIDTLREINKKEIRTLKKEIAVLRFEIIALENEIAEFRRLPNNNALYNRIDLLKKENAHLRQELANDERLNEFYH